MEPLPHRTVSAGCGKRFAWSLVYYELRFRRPARTSRGVYRLRPVWHVRLHRLSDGNTAVGEAAPLPDLNPEFGICYETRLTEACRQWADTGELRADAWAAYPSICFALESAAAQLDAPRPVPATIRINGLVWMGDPGEMLREANEKIAAGFQCIKCKISAAGFEEELDMLTRIRQSNPVRQLELRVDANGAFSAGEALEKLERLAALDVHSIEQPIAPGQWSALSRLIRRSPIPIALDEELTGLYAREPKVRMLETLRPHYIVIKPTIHGGLGGAAEWMNLADEFGIGRWITSALESNIGLAALARFVASSDSPLAQGLGTGNLFEENFNTPLRLEGERLLWR